MIAQKYINLFKHEKYHCVFDWPIGFYQCGDKGVVLSKKGNYTTSYFEAFPETDIDFYRGEGFCIADAEKDCWKQYQKTTSNT